MQADAQVISDGSADNRTGNGGWCSIIRTSASVTELTGWADNTTSNRMEIIAAIEGLKNIHKPSRVTLIADSAYLLETIKQKKWNRWFKEQEEWAALDRVYKRPNMDLWFQMAGLTTFHTVTCIKVKGHSGDYWNNRADKLASFARKNQTELNSVLPNLEEEEWLYPFTTILNIAP